MLKNAYFDTETCGLHGPIVLFQYAIEDGPINLYLPWEHPVGETIELFEWFCENHSIIGFNLSFDWFHIVQMYTTLLEFGRHDNVILLDAINEYAVNEKKARDCPYTIKPYDCFDLMLYARKGPYQSMMNREDIRVKRVPTAIAFQLAEELDKRIPIDDIYFARKSDPSKHWHVMDVKNDLDEIVTEFKDIVLKFAPSSALKALAKSELGAKDVIHFAEIEPAENMRPKEVGYAPFALAPYYDNNGKLCVPTPRFWHYKWPMYIRHHHNHWAFNELAREYGTNDVVYTRDLYKKFGITKDMHNDDDSVLACMIACVRWRGYKVDLDGIMDLKRKAQEIIASEQKPFGSSDFCRKYLEAVMSETERSVLSVNSKITTKAPILEEIERWRNQDICMECQGQGTLPNGSDCEKCHAEGMIFTEDWHPAALRAKEIITYRKAKKRIELCDKILAAERFHADFIAIGALSNRMAGTGGLNPQGIDHAKEVRVLFKFAWDDMILCGGDFEGSQMAIAAAVYDDPQLNADLQQMKMCDGCKGSGIKKGNKCPDCKGKGEVKAKLYPIFGQYLFPGMSYEEIVMTKGFGGEEDKYDRSKKGVLAMLFGGEAYTLANRVGISEKASQDGYDHFVNRYPVWGKKRGDYSKQFCSMTQPDGIGTEVIWQEPAEYIESIFGFRRYFTTENKVVKALFKLAQNPPDSWKKIKIKVRRSKDREQTAGGATQSALYAAAFACQAANMRAAANHVIQSPEASLVKVLQHRIWNLQPSGVHKWIIMPANIHDELMAPTIPEKAEETTRIVDDFVEEYRQFVPLMSISWETGLGSWAEK